MATKQLTVSCENRPGTLAHMAKVLADAKVNITALLNSTSGEQGSAGGGGQRQQGQEGSGRGWILLHWMPPAPEARIPPSPCGRPPCQSSRTIPSRAGFSIAFH